MKKLAMGMARTIEEIRPPAGGGVTSRPGSASFLDNTRPEANRDWAGRRRWDSVTSAAC